MNKDLPSDFNEQELGSEADIGTKMNVICAIEEVAILQSQNVYIRSLQAEIDRMTQSHRILQSQIESNDANNESKLQQVLT